MFYQSKISQLKINSRQSGFTLIEIMVVVVIIGILASVVVPRIMDNPDKARVAKAKNDIQALGGALDLYRLDNYVYPSSEQGLAALVEKSSLAPEPRNWKQEGYLDAIPLDPWGRPYVIDKAKKVIRCYGKDGKLGGEGADKDFEHPYPKTR